MEILGPFAVANTASSRKGIEAGVELDSIRLQQTTIDPGGDIALGHEQVALTVETLAIGLQLNLDRSIKGFGRSGTTATTALTL